ncbi:glycerophosphodiester phosphodiesterase family protein [Vibrio hannami]|uniref:glycerophosphodiester phosphodiesterase n=1 Tax=Vibrio hannami TaxID=2717094 RepID=UPI00240F004E|nr:glycerophosphodiester phosphodiesterase family protein [Vibrio hannami]MDG3086472.1 glycerophosphodiester phosphodiesterase family protein [Vibrio hannami]
MLASYLVVRATLITLFIPLDIWVTSKLMSVYGVTAIANQELLSFFLSPVGFLLSIWFVSQLSFIFFVEHSTISILLAQHELGKRSIFDTVGLIIQRTWRMFKVVLAQSVGISLLLVSIVWVGRWIFGMMLNDWDINYYLTNQTSSLWWAVGLLVLVTLPVVLLVLRYWANWWLALPLSLFQNCSQWSLFQQARRLSHSIYWHIVIGHVAWLFLRIMVAAILLASFFIALEPALLWATSDPERYPWLMASGLLLFAVSLGVSFVDRFIYASCQFYILRLRTKQLKLVNQTQRRAGLNQQTRYPAIMTIAIVVVSSLAGHAGYSDVRDFVTRLQTDGFGYVTAHRAGGFARAENSEAGIKYAIELGVRSAEIDVQLTKDKQIVVFHDRDLGRMIGDPLVVENATYAQVKEAYLAQKHLPPPLLSDLLDNYADQIEFNIELKRYNKSFELADAISQLLQNYSQAMVLSSLDSELLANVMAQMGAIRPPMLRFALIYAASFGESELERDVDMLMVSEQWLNPWRIIEIQQRQQEVLVWTINSAANMERLYLLGVDSIITDEPALAKEVKANIKTMNFADRALLTLRHWMSL